MEYINFIKYLRLVGLVLIGVGFFILFVVCSYLYIPEILDFISLVWGYLNWHGRIVIVAFIMIGIGAFILDN